MAAQLSQHSLQQSGVGQSPQQVQQQPRQGFAPVSRDVDDCQATSDKRQASHNEPRRSPCPSVSRDATQRLASSPVPSASVSGVTMAVPLRKSQSKSSTAQHRHDAPDESATAAVGAAAGATVPSAAPCNHESKRRNPASVQAEGTTHTHTAPLPRNTLTPSPGDEHGGNASVQLSLRSLRLDNSHGRMDGADDFERATVTVSRLYPRSADGTATHAGYDEWHGASLLSGQPRPRSGQQRPRSGQQRQQQSPPGSRPRVQQHAQQFRRCTSAHGSRGPQHGVRIRAQHMRRGTDNSKLPFVA